jgi:hypothetical protein
MGPWGIIALIAMATVATEAGRNSLKKAVRATLRAGYSAKRSTDGLTAKAKSYRDEIVAEISAEREESSEDQPKEKKRSKAQTR